jgi:hypothetical protein
MISICVRDNYELVGCDVGDRGSGYHQSSFDCLVYVRDVADIIAGPRCQLVERVCHINREGRPNGNWVASLQSLHEKSLEPCLIDPAVWPKLWEWHNPSQVILEGAVWSNAWEVRKGKIILIYVIWAQKLTLNASVGERVREYRKRI